MTTQRIADPANRYVLEVEDRTDLFGDAKKTEPDPDWRFTDPEGHEHRWQFMNPKVAADNPEGASPYLPTLRYVADDEKTGHHECKQCRWPVRPEKRSRTSMRVAGLFDGNRIYRLNGRRIDENLAKAVFRVIQDMCDDREHVLQDVDAVPLSGSSSVHRDSG